MAVKKDRPLKKIENDRGKAASWVVAISGLIAAIAALVSVVTTLVMALKQ